MPLFEVCSSPCLESAPFNWYSVQPKRQTVAQQGTSKVAVPPTLAIFDARVDDLSTLLNQLQPGVRAHVLDPARDGIQQITTILKQFPSASVTLVAHGFSGGLQLGATRLASSNLLRYRTALQTWFSPVTTSPVATSPAVVPKSTPELSLLACNVAAGETGMAFIEQLATYTGAIVSAAKTVLGNRQWPAIAHSIFTPTALNTYSATLGLALQTIITDGDTSGTQTISGLDGALGVTVSPDGTQVFVTGDEADALVIFDLDERGNLTLRATFQDGVDGVDGLDSAYDVAFSPDGSQVFVASAEDSALTLFDRDAEGNVTFNTTFKDNVDGVDGLSNAHSVAVSPDGTQVFVTGGNNIFIGDSDPNRFSGDSALAVFDRDANGNLTFREALKNGENGIDGLAGAYEVVVSPDGTQVFVAGYDDDALVVFDRDTEGNLTFNTVFKDGDTNNGQTIDGLNGAISLDVSPDGTQVFVAGYTNNAIAIFDREAGVLTFDQVLRDNENGIDGLEGTWSVRVSPDGNQVFATGDSDSALAVFNRSAEGELSFDTAFIDGQDGISGLEFLGDVAIHPDSNQVFVAGFGDDTLVVFDEERFTSTDNSNVLEVTRLGTSNTVELQLADAVVDSVSEIVVFSVGATGDNKTQIARFSLLEDGQLPTDFAPTFALESDLILAETFLQFELVENGRTYLAMPNAQSNDQAKLTFSNGTQLMVAFANSTSTTNVLINDAAAIDLSAQTGTVNFAFTVYREAAFNNTVGLYSTDFADGGITTDAVLGIVVRPGDPDYQEEALKRKLDIELTGNNGEINQTSASGIAAGGYLGLYLIEDGNDPATSDVHFSYAGANSDGADHVKLLGNNTFGFEDSANLGDADFNDLVVSFTIE
ncbi:MAG: DUF4347 domain-containing protein [Phormidesmis sp.]